MRMDYKEIASLFGLAEKWMPPKAPRYNVAPSTFVPVIRTDNGTRELTELRWGLVLRTGPTRSKPKLMGYPLAQSADEAAHKPAFRDALRSRRCLVIVDGFFEWKTLGNKKIPYYFSKGGGGVLALAAVWDRWIGVTETLETVSILTVSSNELIEPLHDRMPAIIPEGQFEAWLNPKKTRAANVLPLLTLYPADRMAKWRVSDQVNHVRSEAIRI